jgi:carbonyl reductase 1
MLPSLTRFLNSSLSNSFLFYSFKVLLSQVNDPTPFSEQATNTIRINFTGTLNVCNALFPLLRDHARVVNVSSRAGMLRIVKDPSIRSTLTKKDLTAQEVVDVMDTFVR